MKDLNSAAQVSTFLNTGKTFSATLLDLTICSFIPVIFDNFLSEKPIDFILLNSVKFLGKPLFLILVSLSTISLICSKNHGSIFDKLKIFFIFIQLIKETFQLTLNVRLIHLIRKK